MAAYTSTTTGNWSSTATWGGSGPPGTGDTATIANGTTVTVDVNTTVGNSTSAVGPAITINGSSSTIGTLIVATGVTLTLQGHDNSSNPLMKINQYGLFAPAGGSTIVGVVPSDFGSAIFSAGRIEPSTTSGSRVAFTTPSASQNWAVSSSSEAKTWAIFDNSKTLKIGATALSNMAVSNSTHTGLGSVGNSSLTINSSYFSMTSEVASLAAIVSAGQYYVDYDMGVIYLGITTWVASKTANVSYYHLDKSSANWRGWGIISNGAATGNTCLLQYCDFTYMGTSTTGTTYRSCPVVLQNHLTAGANAGSTARLAYVKNCTFNFCYNWVQLNSCQGKSDGTDQFLITGNTFNEGSGTTASNGINVYYQGYSSYVTVDSNAVNTRGSLVDLSSGPSQDCPGWRVTNNTGCIGSYFINGGRTPWPSRWCSRRDDPEPAQHSRFLRGIEHDPGHQ